MRFTQIRINDFKLFNNIIVDLKPITLLTGVNSSGKSALLAGLAAMLQTPPPYVFPFEIVLNGDNCSLGSYADVARGHSTKVSFGFGFSTEHAKVNTSLDTSFRYSPQGDHILPNKVMYSADSDSMDIVWQPAKRKYECRFVAPNLVKLREDKDFNEFIQALSKLVKETEYKSKKGLDVKLKIDISKKIFPKSLSPEESIPIGASPRDLADRISSNALGAYLMNNLREFIRLIRSHVGYVGPIRATPLRHYAPDRPHFSVDPQGANCAQLLNDWRKHSKTKFELVADLLAKLELVQQVHTRSSTDEILKILVKPFSRSEVSNYADVGFGVSQVLPVLVSDVALPDSSVLLINQPEVHLHPSSQAQLANYFVSRLSQRQFIIETHSEYIINRLRVLTMKGTLDPNLVSIVFLKNSTTYPGVVDKHEITLNDDGSLNNAPEEFFQTYYVDSFDLAMGRSEDAN